MNNTAFSLIDKYAKQLAAMEGLDQHTGKIMVNLNGRIYETEDGCDFGNLQTKDISIVSGAMGSSYAIEHKLLKNEPEIKAIVLSNTTFCKTLSARFRSLTASLDDMAQIVGPKVELVQYDERALSRALHKASGCFVRDKYTVTTGRNLYEAVIALEVLEKAAEIDLKAELIGGAKPLSIWEAKRMRRDYRKNYSKAEQEVKSAEGRK